MVILWNEESGKKDAEFKYDSKMKWHLLLHRHLSINSLAQDGQCKV